MDLAFGGSSSLKRLKQNEIQNSVLWMEKKFFVGRNACWR